MQHGQFFVTWLLEMMPWRELARAPASMTDSVPSMSLGVFPMRSKARNSSRSPIMRCDCRSADEQWAASPIGGHTVQRLCDPLAYVSYAQSCIHSDGTLG